MEDARDPEAEMPPDFFARKQTLPKGVKRGMIVRIKTEEKRDVVFV